MRIKINNFFKFKTKERKSRGEVRTKSKARNQAAVKEPAFKVYSGEGKIIKYEPYKRENRQVEESARRRKGAENIGRSANFSGSSKEILVEKYRDRICSENEDADDNFKIKKKQKSGSRGAYLLFGFMLILAGYSLSFSYNRYKDLNQEDYAVYNSEDIEESIVMPEEQSSVSNNLDTIKTEEVVKTSTSVATNTTKVQVPKVTPLSFAKPLDGEILKIYSADKVIYSKTLELWKTHDGIDIKAHENTIVKAIEKGTIEKIYDDSFYGKTIVIDHGQGYKSSYSNLSEEVFVKEKQVVTKLSKIGKVGKTAIGEIKDESHLHFTLIKNNKICDPSSIFN